ncbi:MAG TPA: gamma-glutamylcyclotransferase [Chromatiaceae bacterium]|jgi:gamma-glutamylcyclotransferase|nr:MAG: hypothetical protein N838_05505 [Thiohalocapsa sp. PB-PSB1]QQO56948.1 MAG: gamma-glutamylcyclotransferase [Thiohalocapsa sp. PB-PSB1]HBG96254.1 gamma-glutamylcyclotransferase [Chromatiaceae bacterium]
MGSYYYLAFGSNLLSLRLQARTGNVRLIGPVDLHGWRLTFHKRGSDGSGKGDIVPGTRVDRVFGVLYELDERQLAVLDEIEGPGYVRDRIEVGCNGRRFRCMLYRAVAEAIDPTLEPYDWYHQLILAGLLEQGVDADYYDKVRCQNSSPDPRPRRPARLHALTVLDQFSALWPDYAARLHANQDRTWWE